MLGFNIVKILFCVDSMNAGGAERVVSILSNEFSRIGHDVTIVMVSGLKNSSFYKLDTKVKLICLHGIINKTHYFKRVRILRRIIKYCAPTIIISFLPHINIYTYFALMGLRIQHIVSERNNPYLEPSNFFIRKLRDYVFKRADGCVFQTHDAANYYKNISNGIIIHNPVNVVEIDNTKSTSRTKTIVYVGRLTKQKNLPLLLKSFALFLKKHPDYTLKIYGIGEEMASLKQLAISLSIVDKIIFMGESLDWQKNEVNAGIFVLPSDYEGMPNSLLEAMALCIPCISTDCPIGGPKEIIKNGVNGLLVPCNSETSMASAMISLASDKEKAIILSNANLNLRDELSPSLIAKKWIEYIFLLLNK